MRGIKLPCEQWVRPAAVRGEVRDTALAMTCATIGEWQRVIEPDACDSRRTPTRGDDTGAMIWSRPLESIEREAGFRK